MFLLRKINKTAAPKKGRKIINASPKMITRDEWIAGENIRKEKTKAK